MKVLRFVRPYVESTMTDYMNIYRHEVTVNEYGATEVGFPDKPLYERVPCRLSWSEMESPRDYTEDYTPVELPIKVFCKYNQDIRAGDYVIIMRLTENEVIDMYKGICSDTRTMESHKELYFRVQEPA